MRNKPNFQKTEMNLNHYIRRDYKNNSRLRTPEKQTQSNPSLSAFYPPTVGWRVYPPSADFVFSGYFFGGCLISFSKFSNLFLREAGQRPDITLYPVPVQNDMHHHQNDK